jgi:class 3 adenylate cyclase
MAEASEPSERFRPTSPGRAEFEALLGELIERPYDREMIERRIEERFTQERAVMVLDMTGFSRTTQIRGVVPYLLMIHQMRLLASPEVEEHGGTAIAAEADNLLCLFPTVDEALSASRHITDALRAANLVLPGDFELYVSIGLGYGPILNIDDEQIAGNELNLASKLGEDVADLGEVLLTEAARAKLESSESFEEHLVSISGLEVKYYRLQV